jgi:hypothetical protein
LTASLAIIAANEAQATAMINITTDALNAFQQLNA